jgi:Flp pilus assembly protein TadD
VAAGQPKKAEQVLERAAKSSSSDARYWVQLGDLYTRSYLKEDGSSQPADLEK